MTTPSSRSGIPAPATRRTRRALAAVIVLALAVLLPTTTVSADATLESTEPEAGSSGPAPSEIVATFDQELREAGSSIELLDPDGDTIATGGVDPADVTRLLIADLPDLPDGEYQARWVAASSDGHLIRDTWEFTIVAPATPPPTPTPEPSATAAPTPTSEPSEPAATPAPTPAASPDPGDEPAGGMDVILPIVLGLTIVAVAAVALIGRRGRTPSA